jgi:hypothetical protein
VGVSQYLFDPIVTGLLGEGMDAFNLKYREGNNLSKKYPTVKFVAGLLGKTLLTPYSEDANIFGGFKWISDFF